MTTDSNRLRYLLEKYAESSCTRKELRELFSYVRGAETNGELYSFLEKEWNQLQPAQSISGPDWDRMFSEIVSTPFVMQVEKQSRKFQWKWVAAASIVLLIGVGSYFLFFNHAKQNAVAKTNQPLLNDVRAPVNNRATITLGDGKKVLLDSVSNGMLATQGNVNVVKLADGKIVYNGSAKEVIYNTLTNPRGSKVIDMTLIDGSHVWLNAGSSITYPVAFVESERKVAITGEAYFEVTHDASKPFIVSKGETTVKVLGTRFNVNTYDDEPGIKVTLLEGSVNVRSGLSIVKITPGQQAEVTDKINVADNVDVDEVMAWKNGKFQFGEKSDIQTIMRQIARWYDVEIEYKGKINGLIGGSISRNVNVSGILNMLEKTGEARFKIEGKKIIVLQ